MGIILADRAVATSLASWFTSFNPTLIDDVLDEQFYDPKDIQNVRDYIELHPIKLKAGYPIADVQIPAIYIAQGNTSPGMEVIGDVEVIESTIDQINLKTGMAARGLQKDVRLTCVAQDPIMASVLAALVEYVLVLSRTSLEGFQMSNQTISYPEIDFVTTLFPQNFFYRTLIASYMVFDTFKPPMGASKIIARITIGNINGGA